MLTKLLEIRDEGTCIPAMATEAIPASPEQRAILGRAGYGDSRCIIEHWDDLRDGDVIDVQFILGETAEKKASEIQGVYA